MTDDQWAARMLDGHRKRIRLLEGQVAALTRVLALVAPALPHDVKPWLVGELAAAVGHLSKKKEEAQEPDELASDAERQTILSVKNALSKRSFRSHALLSPTSSTALGEAKGF